jgi:cell division protein FtsI/penicillin-binding protein 2
MSLTAETKQPQIDIPIAGKTGTSDKTTHATFLHVYTTYIPIITGNWLIDN